MLRLEDPAQNRADFVELGLPAISERSLQRFLDQILFRYDAAIDRLSNPKRCEAALTALPPAELGD